eukprot:TRINITY_DN6701_c0_g2_i1.p1 TRINITY_DN6701_c0_g2~~TRINITY_DN6701_c0_g2_i1.p1  ORF type:complete len:423 (+),score=112.87 TRINITY_DN6701_c0_g2_i1:94-1362(+)
MARARRQLPANTTVQQYTVDVNFKLLNSDWLPRVNVYGAAYVLRWEVGGRTGSTEPKPLQDTCVRWAHNETLEVSLKALPDEVGRPQNQHWEQKLMKLWIEQVSPHLLQPFSVGEAFQVNIAKYITASRDLKEYSFPVPVIEQSGTTTAGRLHVLFRSSVVDTVVQPAAFDVSSTDLSAADLTDRSSAADATPSRRQRGIAFDASGGGYSADRSRSYAGKHATGRAESNGRSTPPSPTTMGLPLRPQVSDPYGLDGPAQPVRRARDAVGPDLRTTVSGVSETDAADILASNAELRAENAKLAETVAVLQMGSDGASVDAGQIAQLRSQNLSLKRREVSIRQRHDEDVAQLRSELECKDREIEELKSALEAAQRRCGSAEELYRQKERQLTQYMLGRPVAAEKQQQQQQQQARAPAACGCASQ